MKYPLKHQVDWSADKEKQDFWSFLYKIHFFFLHHYIIICFTLLFCVDHKTILSQLLDSYITHCQGYTLLYLVENERDALRMKNRIYIL